MKHLRSIMARAAALAFEGAVATGAAFTLPAAMAADAPAGQGTTRIEITGSAIRRIEAEGALPVTVISRDAIDRSGASSVTELIQALPAMTGGNFQQACRWMPSSGSKF